VLAIAIPTSEKPAHGQEKEHDGEPVTKSVKHLRGVNLVAKNPDKAMVPVESERFQKFLSAGGWLMRAHQSWS